MVRHEQLVHRTHVRDLFGERHQPLQRDRDTDNEPRHGDLPLEPRQEHLVLDPGPQPAVLLRVQSRVQRLHSDFFVIPRPEPAGDNDWNPLKVASAINESEQLVLENTENHNRPKTSPYHAQDEERKTRRNTTLVAATHLAGLHRLFVPRGSTSFHHEVSCRREGSVRVRSANVLDDLAGGTGNPSLAKIRG